MGGYDKTTEPLQDIVLPWQGDAMHSLEATWEHCNLFLQI